MFFTIINVPLFLLAGGSLLGFGFGESLLLVLFGLFFVCSQTIKNINGLLCYKVAIIPLSRFLHSSSVNMLFFM